MHTTDILWTIALVVSALIFIGFVAKGGDTIRTEEPYDGLIGSDNWNRMQPRGYVVYPPCEECPYETRSIEMPIGNARDYARIFGGSVVEL